MDFKINTTGVNSQLSIILRNNFGKPINITNVVGDEIAGPASGLLPIILDTGNTAELRINLGNTAPIGEKKEVNPTIIFHRDGATNSHNITGTVFVTVQ